MHSHGNPQAWVVQRYEAYSQNCVKQKGFCLTLMSMLFKPWKPKRHIGTPQVELRLSGLMQFYSRSRSAPNSVSHCRGNLLERPKQRVLNDLLYRGQGFLGVVWFGSSKTLSPRFQSTSCLSFSVLLWVAGHVMLANRREAYGGGVGAKSEDGKKSLYIVPYSLGPRLDAVIATIHTQ